MLCGSAGVGEGRRGFPSLLEHAEGEKCGEIAGSVNNADYLDRICLPHVCDHVGVEVPEAESSAEQLLMEVADSWRLTQLSETRIEFSSQPFRGFWAFLGDIEQDRSEIVLSFRC